MASSSVQLRVDASGALNPIRQVQKAAQALSTQFERLKGSAKNAATGALELGRTLEQNTRRIREQTTSVQGLIGAYAGFRTLKGAITAGVELETAQKRAELLTQRFGQLSGIQQVAAQSADKFRIAQSDTLAALIDLGNRLGPQGASLAEIRDVYDGFNTVLAINKVSTQEAASAQLQLNQALGSGRLAGEEFRAVNEATPQVIDAVAKILGVARGEVKELASEGAVTAPVLIQALRDIKDKGASELERSFDSASGRLRAFQKAQTELAQAIGLQLLPAFTPLLTAVTDLIKGFAALPGPARAVVAGVVGITTALIALAPVITGAIGLLKALGVATLISAGPWVALAAGITAAAVALASYQTQAQKTAKGAATGDAAGIKKANDELYVVNTKITQAVEARAKATGRERATLDRQVQALRRDQAQLQQGLATGRKTLAAQDQTGGLDTGAPAADTGKADKAAAKAAKEAAEREKQIQERLRALKLERELTVQTGMAKQLQYEAERAGDKQLLIRLQAEEEINKITNQLAATNAEITDQRLVDQNILNATQEILNVQAETERKLAEDQRTTNQRRMDDMKKFIEQQYELNKGVQQQKALAEGVSSVIGQSMTSAFNALISGAQSWQQSLEQIASGVLIDIANQLLQIFVIEQAINAIRTFLTPFNPATPFGAGGGTVGRYGTLGPNYGIPQRAKGGSVSAGQPYLVGERGPELFMPGRSGGIAPTGSFGGSNIVVNVDASGSNVQGNQPDAAQLGRAIGAAVQAELIKQKRPGGLLA